MHLDFKSWSDLFKGLSFTKHHIETRTRREKRLMHEVNISPRPHTGTSWQPWGITVSLLVVVFTTKRYPHKSSMALTGTIILQQHSYTKRHATLILCCHLVAQIKINICHRWRPVVLTAIYWKTGELNWPCLLNHGSVLNIYWHLLRDSGVSSHRHTHQEPWNATCLVAFMFGVDKHSYWQE
jgi:hypothetical protein